MHRLAGSDGHRHRPVGQAGQHLSERFEESVWAGIPVQASRLEDLEGEEHAGRQVVVGVHLGGQG